MFFVAVAALTSTEDNRPLAGALSLACNAFVLISPVKQRSAMMVVHCYIRLSNERLFPVVVR